MTTPEGTQTKTVFDALGRTVKTYQNYKTGTSTAADEDVTIQYEYDGADNIATLTAVNPTTGDQITRYLYEDPYNTSFQTSAIYPDSSDTTSSGSDQVKTQYYLDGNVKQITDQNGTVRTFTYDNHRRLISDHATTLGSGVDDAVRKLTRSYNNFGAMEALSSQDAQNAILDEIKYEYDANQRLKKLYQSHSGTVSPTTPHVEYAYDETNQGRLSGVVYPSGKELTYEYDSSGAVVAIRELQAVLAEYTHNGIGATMQTSYPEPSLSLAHTASGLDRFGRVINHGWLQGETPLVHILHGYDFAGNRTFRYDTVHAANSELYEYDAVNQIKSLNRGILSPNNDSVTNSTFTESWNFDKTGNWQQYDKNGNSEARTHNKANELQGIATHDANGNMTLMPGLKGKYDAWNRLVEVRDTSDNFIARYEYNGANHRVKKTTGGIVTKSFFNEQWQELESQTNDELTTYVWGLRYIDDLIYREKDNERLYALQDPNWNTVAITDSSGEVKERYKYDAFGKSTVLNENFTEKPISSYLWNRTFTGQVYDLEAGLMLYRMRFYHAGLGRFVNRDPIAYRASDANLYRYVRNAPLRLLDPSGLVDFKEGGYIIRVYGADADTQIPGGHGHILSPDTINGQHAMKVSLPDGQIYTSNNVPTGRYLPKKVLEKFSDWVKCKVKTGQGGGYVGVVIFVLLAAPEIAQAGEEEGGTGVIKEVGSQVEELIEGAVASAGVGTGIIATTAGTGGTFTFGGTAIVSGGTMTTGGAVSTFGTATGVGGMAIAAGAGGYAVGNAVGGIEIGGQSIHTWIGEGMYKAGDGITKGVKWLFGR